MCRQTESLFQAVLADKAVKTSGAARPELWMAGESRWKIHPLQSPSLLVETNVGRDRWKSPSICQQTDRNKLIW